ncbi:MAG: FAD-dependent oxidoreductase [Pseudomonadota bacterium]
MNKLTTNSLPIHASVVVIGGGVMGCSTLYHLAKAGVRDAILIERNKLTSGTTWHSAAQVRALRSTRNLTDLIRYSVSLYSSLEEETGQSTGWINKGSLSIATNQARLTHIRRQESLAHLFGVDANSISVEEAKERWPLMNAEDVIGAVWSPDDGRVSPSDLCAALVKGARSRGAKIFEDTGVIGIRTQGGKVCGLETTAGEIQCDAIALCTGLWSRENAAMAGADVPLYPCEHFYLLTKAVPGAEGNLPTLSDHDSHLYIRDDSGGLLVGCFEPIGKAISPQAIGTDSAFTLLPEDWEHFEPMMENALHRLPALANAEVRMLLNGPECFTPDSSFLLGETAETRGLFLGCGMNSVGVATGGGAGMALAHCIVHGHTPSDLSEADPKRFPNCWNSAKALTERAPQVLGEHYAIHFPGYQWSTVRNLRHTPLHNKWIQHRAHFGQFFGWERPLFFNKQAEPKLTFNQPDWFDQVGAEVTCAHESAAVFDLSTFGKIRVTGKDAETFLNRVCANDMTRTPGRAIYTGMLNARGGFESDLTALRLADDDYRLYVGTGAIKRDMAWLKRNLQPDESVALIDETEDYAVLGLMGPDSPDLVEKLDAGELLNIGFFQHAEVDIAGIAVRAARLSYVGEEGWELTCKSNEAESLFDHLLQFGAQPAGIFAQTSMRIEKRFLAYGHDLDTDINPIQAGLDFAVDWNSDFIGRDALERARQNGATNEVFNIILDDADTNPLGNEPVYLTDRIIGKTSAAAYGYRIQQPVAIAQIKPEFVCDALKSDAVEIDIAGERFHGKIVKKAF